MEQLTLEQAAKAATEILQSQLFIKDSYEQNEYLEGYHKGFKEGGEWQKEQYKELINLARQLLGAYDIRYPDAKQLLVGYTNEAAFLKFNQLLEQLQPFT